MFLEHLGENEVPECAKKYVGTEINNIKCLRFHKKKKTTNNSRKCGYGYDYYYIFECPICYKEFISRIGSIKYCRSTKCKNCAIINSRKYNPLEIEIGKIKGDAKIVSEPFIKKIKDNSKKNGYKSILHIKYQCLLCNKIKTCRINDWIRNYITKCNSCSSTIKYMYLDSTSRRSGFNLFYKNTRLRSLLELSYILKIEQEGKQWKSAEHIKIPYIREDGKECNYHPDFLVENAIIEVKPLERQNDENIKLKSLAAEKYCKENNLTYLLTDVSDFKLSDAMVKKLYEEKIIIFTPKSEAKFRIKMGYSSVESIESEENSA